MKHVVALDVELGADGAVQAVMRMNGAPSPLDDVAIAAVKQSTFSPAIVKGTGAPMRKDIFVVFRGNGQPGELADKASQPPLAITQAEAEFSEMDRKLDYQGEVLLRILVTADGNPADIQVLRHLPGSMDEQAIKAAKKYRFSPAKMNGEPVPVHIYVGINFRRY